MLGSAPILQEPADILISPWSTCALGPSLVTMGIGGPGSGTIVAANMALFYPFRNPWPITVTKVWVANGAGVSGNWDVAVYDESWARLVSAGTTGQSGANVLQAVDVTDTVIGRGRYYLSIVGSTLTTATYVRSAPAAGILQSLGCLQQDISGIGFPLPATATPAKITTACLPLFGIQCGRAVGP